MKTTTVMIPTYNESENIQNLIKEILDLKIPGHELNVLVVDDKSPDGTGKTVETMGKNNPKIKLLTRSRRGRGTAGIDGFIEALKSKPDYVIEMDADFSHDPKYIPSLITAADDGADLVIGSRFIPGGADMDRGPLRKVLSLAAGVYVRTVLGVKLKDVTAGYRLYKRKVLESIELQHMISEGPSIVQETLYKVFLKGFKIVEVPIIFVDRRLGSSKLDSKKLAECLYMSLRIRTMNTTGKLFKEL